MTLTTSLRDVVIEALNYAPASVEGETLTVHPSFRGMSSCETLLASKVEGLRAFTETTSAIAAKLEPMARAAKSQSDDVAKMLAAIAAQVGPLTSAAGTYREVRRRGALVYRHNAHVMSDALGAVPLRYLDELAEAVLDGRRAIERALTELDDDAPESVRLVLLLALELLDDLAGYVEAFTIAKVLDAGHVENSQECARKPKRSTFCAHHRRHLVATTQLDDPAPSLGFTLNAYGAARRRLSSFIGGN